MRLAKNSNSTTSSSAPSGAEAERAQKRVRPASWLRLLAIGCLGLALSTAAVTYVLAQTPAPKPQQEAPNEWQEAVKEATAGLQRQVSSLAESAVSLLGEKNLGPKDIRAIVEVMALQRAVEVFANLVASYARTPQQEVIVQSLPMIDEYWRRVEEALAEAPNMEKMVTLKPPSAAHPVSIRSTLEELRASLGLPKEAGVARQEAVEPRPELHYLGPEPTDDEMQITLFNLQRLRAAAERMGQGKCYREFWTRNCADALEYHALPHQKRSFVKLLVTTRDLLRKYCDNPRLSSLQKEYEGLIQHLSVRPIVFDYGSHTTPFVDRPELFQLQCEESG
jgi:hypothetical protein